jgi:hypothetical protein
MSGIYSDNRFNDSRMSQYSHKAPLGPHGRRAFFSVNTKVLSAYPGWHSVHMHADYAYSVDCSTRDVLGCIAQMQAEWEAELTARYGGGRIS